MTFDQWWDVEGVGYSSYEDLAKDAWDAGRASSEQLLAEEQSALMNSGMIIERLSQQLAEREAQGLVLIEALEKVRGHGRLYNLFSCVGGDSYDPECADLNAQKCREIAEEALAATDDLSGYILCEREPVSSILQASGNPLQLYRAKERISSGGA